MESRVKARDFFFACLKFSKNMQKNYSRGCGSLVIFVYPKHIQNKILNLLKITHMKRFLKVSAIPCNENGNSRVISRKEFFLNIDLIGAIENETIHPKDGTILKLNGSYFKELKISEKINLQDL